MFHFSIHSVEFAQYVLSHNETFIHVFNKLYPFRPENLHSSIAASSVIELAIFKVIRPNRQIQPYLLGDAIYPLFTNADAVFVHNPKRASESFTVQFRHDFGEDRQHMGLVLALQAQYNDATILVGWVGADVGEIRVEGDDGALFALADGGDGGVRLADHLLFVDRARIILGLAQDLSGFNREIFVHLELKHGGSDREWQGALAR